MSGYVSSCPACGAEVRFALGASLLKVCEHCGSAIAREGANLKDYGKVAALLPTPSVLALGAEGRQQARGAFRIIGRLQLQYQAGTWDEWRLAFADGSSGWLAEAQGRFYLTQEAPLPPVPAHGEIRPEQTIDLGAPGVFVVREVRSARFASAQGELDFAVRPGSELRYADLSGPKNRFATLDYGAGTTALALYVGETVAFEALGFRDLRPPEERAARAAGKSLTCTQCGGPLEVRAPDATQRVACPYCGSLLDATRDLQVLQVLDKPPFLSPIPLGTAGTFAGASWTAIGALQRVTRVEGVAYRWREVLLYGDQRGFRWLVEMNGHWSWVTPIDGTVMTAREGQQVPYEGTTFKHFQSSPAEVEGVLGEFYWAVAAGDRVEGTDYVAPPRMLSREKDENEVTWSLGRYVEPEEVWKAFALAGAPPRPVGVFAHQPNPHQGSRAAWKEAALAAALLFAVYLGIAAIGTRGVLQKSFPLTAELAPGSPESTLVTEPFEVKTSSNLEVRVSAPVDNSWLYLQGALFNEGSGEVDEFDVEVSYYHGSDSDGSWSEGSRTTTRFLPRVRPGKYVLRLDPQWEAGRMPSAFDLKLRSRVPRGTHFLLALLAVLAWPLWLGLRYLRFENARWAESDHPWNQSSSDKDDD